MAMYHLVKQAQASIPYQNQGAFIIIDALYSMFRSLFFISRVLAAKYVDPALRTNIYLAKVIMNDSLDAYRYYDIDNQNLFEIQRCNNFKTRTAVR